MWGDFDPWRGAAVALDVLALSHAEPAQIARRQRERLLALLEAADAAPFWRERLRGRRPEDGLSGLRPVGKREWMANFDRCVTDARLTLPALQAFVADPQRIGEPFEGRWIVWESSGSSGEPGLFVQDVGAMAVYDALEGLRRPSLQPLRRWLDPWLLLERIAFVGATQGHFASTVSMRRITRLQPGFAQRSLGVDVLQPLAAVVAQLNDFAPTVIATYPSAALLLAGEARAGRLRVAPLELWTGGETLGAAVRAEVESAFGCPLADSYGASEFLAMASSCTRGRLHLNADWVILEPVDRQGRPVPPGVAGDSARLTNLANHVQPLIRYELHDRITLHAERCGCGSPLPVVEVQGRSDDVLTLKDGRGRVVRLLPLALVSVLEEQAGVFDFQLVQTGPRSLRLDLAAQHSQADPARAGAALRAWALGAGPGRRPAVAAPRAGRGGRPQRQAAAGDRACSRLTPAYCR
ncbi:phenylacetate--CoA ligase family protein [Piscinibacter aquaticus]|uniref:Phenylacetate--CoA ligase family protein n=1 Tax=Piscinibacter aquaticus TaxID=392597 RepID=A0A5C6TXU2_9BURK|nr:phenylacetate--CoA ligase family protein [Piscinibacter aquaticus]